MEGKGPLLLPESDWDDPEARRRKVGEALAVLDREVLIKGFRRYLAETRGQVDDHKVFLVENFLFWLKREGRRWPDLKAGDARAFLEELKDKGAPLSPFHLRGGGRSDATVARAHSGLKHFQGFLEWAGHTWPAHVDLPPRPLPFGSHEALTEDEYARLLAAVEEEPQARHRDLMRAIVRLVGERGFRLAELIESRLEDYDGKKGVLRVRYPRPREVPLNEEAVEAVERWLETREAIASLLPHPPARLFLRTSRGPGYGRPLEINFLRDRLRRLFARAGLEREAGYQKRVHRLRWRAVRKLFSEGYDKAEVARILGQENIEDL